MADKPIGSMTLDELKRENRRISDQIAILQKKKAEIEEAFATRQEEVKARESVRKLTPAKRAALLRVLSAKI